MIASSAELSIQGETSIEESTDDEYQESIEPHTSKSDSIVETDISSLLSSLSIDQSYEKPVSTNNSNTKSSCECSFCSTGIDLNMETTSFSVSVY